MRNEQSYERVPDNFPYHMIKRFRSHEHVGPKVATDSLFLWNSDDRTILGRSPKRCFLIILFYVTFYTVLCLIVWACFSVFDTTITNEFPKEMKKQMQFSFQPVTAALAGHIDYGIKDEIGRVTILNQIREFLDKYGEKGRSLFGEKCNEANLYGYTSASPCVFLKVNIILGFEVEPIEDSADFPAESGDMTTFINTLPKDQLKGKLWIECVPSPSVPMKYLPGRYIDIKELDRKETKDMKLTKLPKAEYYKNFFDEEDYGRIIALQFDDVPLDTQISVTCYMYAKNIIIDEEEKNGMTVFRITRNTNENNLTQATGGRLDPYGL